MNSYEIYHAIDNMTNADLLIPPFSSWNVRVEKLLGCGSVSQVYRVKIHDVKYALKVVSHFGLEYCKLELANNKRLLGVKNACQYYGSFEYEDTLYIILELVDGVTLYNFDFTQLDDREIMTVLIKIWFALWHLHEYITHNDLHTGNIMINEKTLDITIVDFGLSSPEQTDTYNIHSDVADLGIITLTILTGVRQILGMPPVTIFDKIDYVIESSNGFNTTSASHENNSYRLYHILKPFLQKKLFSGTTTNEVLEVLLRVRSEL